MYFLITALLEVQNT